MLTVQSQIHNGRKITFMKTGQTWRMYVVYFNLSHSLRVKKDTSKSIPRKLMTRNSRREAFWRRCKGEEKCNNLPRLPLIGGQKQGGTNHLISENQGNHVICTCHEDKGVSLMSMYDQGCPSTESPPAGPPASLRSQLSPDRWLQLFPSQVMLLPFPEEEVVLEDQPPFQESSA